MTGLFIFILGLAVGSFLNVVVYRLQIKQSIIWPPSHCPKCQAHLSWYENLPLVSFVFLVGKCRHCRQKISWQYPLVELATAIIFLLLFNHFGLTTQLMVWLVLACFLIIIFVYDLRYSLILDVITVPAIIFIFLANLFLGFDWLDLTFGAIIGGGFFGLQYLVSSGRWIGDGDIRLGILMGLALGWQMTIVALFLAYIIGAAFGLILILLKKKTLASEISFGTFLTFSTVLTVIWGPQILGFYLGLF
ncbi:MAG: prepilin peptidase [Candidatus Buchananbacteria bacterium]|nr:prepilin peptidase [Candidatus Buchananbacteria bacterium]